MIDKQQLVYDLSLQCAAIEVQRAKPNSLPLSAQMISAFIEAVRSYRQLDPKALIAALDEINKV